MVLQRYPAHVEYIFDRTENWRYELSEYYKYCVDTNKDMWIIKQKSKKANDMPTFLQMYSLMDKKMDQIFLPTKNLVNFGVVPFNNIFLGSIMEKKQMIFESKKYVSCVRI